VLCTRVEIMSEGCRELRAGRAFGPDAEALHKTIEEKQFGRPI